MKPSAKDRLPIELIASARHGDQAALLTLLKISQPDIRRYARTSCKADDVDDAVQDALLVMYRRISGLRVVAAYSGWLFQIVRRACVRRLARRSFRDARPIAEIEDDLAFASKPLLDLRMDLAAAIQSLPDHYRVIVLMRDLEELTIDEIAAALSLSREAVKARLHRARGIMREYLRE